MKSIMQAGGILTAGIAVALAVNLAACSKGKQAPPRTVPVIVETAELKDVPLQLRSIGYVEAYNAVAIKAQVGGEVEGVYFQEGQDVSKGDVLFKIDPAPYETALRQAKAALARDLAQARNAEEQAKRYATLVQKEYVSRDQYEQVRANADALSAAVEADRANVENAALQLSYCTIKSPISGRAGSVLVNNGNVIKANDITLTTVNQIVPIYASFSVPESHLAEIKRHMTLRELKMEAVIPGDESRPVQGELSFIDNAVDRTTGTIRLKGTFQNRDRRLWPGQFIDVVLTLATEQDRVVVPSQSVQTGQQGQFVYVIKEDATAEFRVVAAGRMYQKWTLIDKGLAAGEKVVIDGQVRLVPGVKVEIKSSAVGTQLEVNAKSQTTNTK